jgi:topoisomerase IV subunit A
VRQIKQKEAGKSTIGARKLWYDEITGRLNTQERGALLGEFDTGDTILVLYQNGSYEVTDTDVQQRFDPKEILHLGKFNPEAIISAIHFDGHKGWTMVKRFRVETNKLRERFSYLTDHPKSKLLFATLQDNAHVKYTIKEKGKPLTGDVQLGTFMQPKGWKAVGNKLAEQLAANIKIIEPKAEKPPLELEIVTPAQTDLFGAPAAIPTPKASENGKGKLKAGDVIEFD